MPITPADRSLLLLAFDETRPALETEYVPPPVGCAGDVVADLMATPQACMKALLVGARGGGKSSELREIERQLSDGHGLLVATVDLRASGVSPGGLSAFDLLYMSGLAVLCGVPDGPEAQGLFSELTRAYAGDSAPQLGSLKQNTERLVSFSTAAAATATLFGSILKTRGIDIDAVAGGAAAAITGLGAGGGMVLGSKKRDAVVPETSSEGRSLLEVCTRIVQARRRAAGQKHLCIMIDGLEEMNGEADERFRQVFEQTALLSMAPWSAVISTPPCTLTETKAVEGRGYSTYPVWGFQLEDPRELVLLLEQRCRAAGVDPTDPTAIEPGALALIAGMSGTLPRHAVYVVRRALLAMGKTDRCLTKDHARKGLQFFGQRLCLPLTTDDWNLLTKVHQTRELPREEAASRLFADGRIQVCPPDSTEMVVWAAHPLVLPAVLGRTRRAEEARPDGARGAGGG